MGVWDVLNQGVGLVYSLAVLAVTTLLVARTSRRVLGIQVSAARTLLVSITVFLASFSLVPFLEIVGVQDGLTAANLVTIVALGVGVALGAFAAGLLVLMVLEVIIPTGSLPPPRALFTGWGGRMRRTGRYLRIMGILARYGLTAPLRGVLNTGPTTAESVRRAMEDAGVTFVKLGQMLSTRADLLPPEFIAELSKLTTEAEPQDYAQVREVLAAELGARLDRLTVDPEPLASASVAQVHGALLDGETPVVVKVRRAGAAEQAQIDLQILDRLARTLERNAEWARNLGVLEIARGFAESVTEELDYTIEVDNMAALRPELLAGGVRVPEVFEEFSTSAVITMERFDGVPVVRAAEIIAALPAETRRNSAELLLKAVVGQILAQGVFHADLHSGNVVIWPDGAMGLLDYGSVGRLDASMRRNLGLLLWSVDADDPALATDAVLELLDHGGRVDERELQRSLGMLITRMRSGGTGSSLAFFQLLLRVVLDQGLSVPRSIAMALRSLGALEGTLKIVNPDLDLISTARDLSRGVVGDLSAEGVRKQAANEAIRLVPLLTHLPRRLNRITDDLQNGRLTTNMRIVSHPDDQLFLTGLANQVVVAILAGFAVVGAILLLTSTGGPAIEGRRIYDLLGYLLGFAGFVLALRSVAMVFGRRPDAHH